MIATDRISAFDYVLGSGIPDKGKVLTQLSAFWFERMGDLVPHHLLSIDVADFPAAAQPHADAAARAHDAVPADRAGAGRVRRARLPVRVGLEGISGDRRVCGMAAEGLEGVRSAARADLHAGDEGGQRSRREHQRRRGGADRRRTADPAAEGADARDLRRGCEHAESKGIIIADTKFEFGLVGRRSATTTSS